MFPVVKCSVSGLDPDDNYAVVMDVVTVGDNRFKFHDSEWVVTGKAEPVGNEKGRLYVHPDTPSSGAKWEKQLLTFQKCKITNNHLDQLGYVSLVLIISWGQASSRRLFQRAFFCLWWGHFSNQSTYFNLSQKQPHFHRICEKLTLLRVRVFFSLWCCGKPALIDQNFLLVLMCSFCCMLLVIPGKLNKSRSFCIFLLPTKKHSGLNSIANQAYQI